MLDDLAVFACVAEQRSFAQASRRLGIPTSSVSRAVARLEDRVGVRLLQRTSRTVTTTEEGRRLLVDTGSALVDLERSLEKTAEARAEATGTIKLTAPVFTSSTHLAPRLAEFAKRYPKINVKLDATNALRSLVDDGFDLAVRVGPLADADLVARRAWTGAFALFAAPDFAAKHFGKKRRGTHVASLAAVESAPAIVTRVSSPWRFVGAGGEKIEEIPNRRFAVNDPRAAVEIARTGLGLVLAPIEAVAKGDRSLVRVEPAFGRPADADLFLVYPSKRHLPARVRLLVDFLLGAP